LFSAPEQESDAAIMPADSLPLMSGRRILIVEDEHFLTNRVRTELERLNVDIVGPIPVGEEADRLALTVDAAILDIEIPPNWAFPLAERLQRIRLPYVFAVRGDQARFSEGFPGFLLSPDPEALASIARALFGAPPPDRSV